LSAVEDGSFLLIEGREGSRTTPRQHLREQVYPWQVYDWQRIADRHTTRPVGAASLFRGIPTLAAEPNPTEAIELDRQYVLFTCKPIAALERQV
jgi:hypothetical protein